MHVCNRLYTCINGWILKKKEKKGENRNLNFRLFDIIEILLI